MCGICGIIQFDKKTVSGRELDVMLSHIQKRGPDFTGKHIDGHLALGHQRLSIIDLSESANQPMHSNSCSIVFNGEIYNFQELKKELISQVEFFTSSDTEVLLKGYQVWGIQKLLDKVNGMFAFAILDKDKQKIFLARDRFGEKPLYYLFNDGKVKFSSQINSIFYTEENLSLNRFSLDYYLSELAMPQPQTIWNEVMQVEPSTVVAFDIKSGTKEIQRYWDFKPIEPVKDVSEEEIINETEKILLKSMKSRTISDVPFACFLSGGIDSGLIVSMLSTHSDKRLKTFTVGYDNVKQNEGPLAKKLADRYATDHHEIILKPEVITALDDLIGFIGEPFADPSIIPTYHVCKSISQHVKMAISGDGGDEMFGGYFEFEFAAKTDKWLSDHPNSTFRQWKALMGKVGYRMKLVKENPGHLEAFSKLHPSLYLYRQKGFHPFRKSELYHPDFQFADVSDKTISVLAANWKNSAKATFSDTFFTGSVYPRLNEYLVKVDRASMINSLEVRTPFLDKDLAEFIFKVPAKLKLKNFQTKYLLKKLAQKYMDPDIFSRPKQGFGIPFDEWFRDELQGFVKDVLFSERFKNRRIFNQSYVEKLVNQHTSRIFDFTHRIWLLIVFELWCRKYLDKDV